MGISVEFSAPSRTIEGYLAVPSGSRGSHPGLVVIHEIWGLDDHIRSVADRFAQEGYVVLAPDLYTGEFREDMRPERIRAGMQLLRSAPPEVQRDPRQLQPRLGERTPEERKALTTLMRVMDPSQQKVFAEELTGATRFLRERPEVKPRGVGALGFCMGGGLVARLATLDPELKAAVIFYGSNPPIEEVPRIRAAVLGLYGGEDHRITDTVPEFQEAARRAGIRFQQHVYPGAKHAFFNDSRPEVYDARAAADAHEKVLEFLHRELGP